MPEIVLTYHLIHRLIERGIDTFLIKSIIKSGYIEKVQADGTILVKGHDYQGRVVKVAYFIKGGKIIVKTAFYDDNVR